MQLAGHQGKKNQIQCVNNYDPSGDGGSQPWHHALMFTNQLHQIIDFIVIYQQYSTLFPVSKTNLVT